MVLVASPGSTPVCFGQDTTALSIGFHLALKCERVRFVCFTLLPCILPSAIQLSRCGKHWSLLVCGYR